MRTLVPGILAVLASASSPWLGWATGEASLRVTIVSSLICAFAAAKAWTDAGLTDRREAKNDQS